MTNTAYHILKRTGDILASIALLIVAAPVVAILGLFILLEDGRPVFFKQLRAGRNGKPFTLYKLRSLYRENDPLDPGAHTLRTGRFMRRFGLDELPQLVNVLRGEMSIVGPRPILLAEAQHYDNDQMRRLNVRPGITGWAQVNGRNSLDWQERVDLDLWYVDHAGLMLDLRILAGTPAAVLKSEGVYGPGNLDPSQEDFNMLRNTGS